MTSRLRSPRVILAGGSAIGILLLALLSVAAVSGPAADDPLVRYTGLIDRVRGQLTDTLRAYEAGDSSGSFRHARSAFPLAAALPCHVKWVKRRRIVGRNVMRAVVLKIQIEHAALVGLAL